MSRLRVAHVLLAAMLIAPSTFAQQDAQSQRAYLSLQVPADAKVEVNSLVMKGTGEVRTFPTPPLPLHSTNDFFYTVSVTYSGDDGKDVTVERRVQVKPGITSHVVVSRADAPSTRYGNQANSSYGSPPSQSYATRGNGLNSSYGSSYYGRYYDPSYRPPVGEHWVSGYQRRDGTYVTGHWRTNADNSFWNNYSSAGNTNPHTGKVGTKLPPTSSNSGRR